MKTIKKNIYLILILVFSITACQKEEHWFQDYAGEGDSYAVFSASDFTFATFVDLSGNIVTGSTNEFMVDVRVFGPVTSAERSVTIKVASSSSTAEWTLASTKVIIPAGEASGSVKMTMNKDAAELDKKVTVKLAIDAASEIPAYTNGSTEATVSLTKGLMCAYDIALFTGDYTLADLHGYGYDPVSLLEDKGGNKLKVSTEWDELPSVITVSVDPKAKPINTHAVMGENHTVWTGDLTGWGLGDNCAVTFDDWNPGKAMACTGVVTFKCTPNLADLGAGKNYWWGGEFEFIFTPVGGGMAVEVRPVGNFTKKLTEVIR